MQDHELRVVAEKDDLALKVDRLTRFIDHSPAFQALDPTDQALLARQAFVMLDYISILAERIKRFPA